MHLRVHGHFSPISGTGILLTRRPSFFFFFVLTLTIGRARVRFIVQPPGMVRVRGSWNHDFLSSIKYGDRKFFEKSSSEADEVQG